MYTVCEIVDTHLNKFHFYLSKRSERNSRVVKLYAFFDTEDMWYNPEMRLRYA